MKWRVSGEYVMACTCTGDVHWPIDGSLRDGTGACESVAVFRLDSGDYHGEALDGLTFAIFNFFPTKLSSGSWEMGIVVDQSAGDVRTAGIEAIVRGVEGGPFGAVGFLVGDYLGTDLAGVRYLEGGSPYGDIEGRGRFVFQPTLDSEGQPVLAPNGMFAFAEGYKIGRAQGKVRAFGRAFAVDYGEFGRFSFNDETTGVEREFRPSRITAVYGDARAVKQPQPTGVAPERGARTR
jgi:hypothetical protein